jgi:hypothetical protein
MSPELNSEESLEASQVTGAVKNGCGWRLPSEDPTPRAVCTDEEPQHGEKQPWVGSRHLDPSSIREHDTHEENLAVDRAKYQGREIPVRRTQVPYHRTGSGLFRRWLSPARGRRTGRNPTHPTHPAQSLAPLITCSDRDPLKSAECFDTPRATFEPPQSLLALNPNRPTAPLRHGPRS